MFDLSRAFGPDLYPVRIIIGIDDLVGYLKIGLTP
jgi:hypothetical protein